MPLFHEEAAATEPGVIVSASVAVELDWALAAAFRADYRRDHSCLARVYEESPELAERVRSFWGPGEVMSCGGSIELMVLAQHGGLLFSTDAEALLGRLEELCATAPVDLPLASETEEDRVVVLGRLRRLRSTPELRRRYVEMVADVWSAISEDWERDGRRSVEAAVHARREQLAKGASWREMARTPCADFDLLSRLAASLGPDGLIAIFPAFFAHLGSLVDMPGVLMIGVRADSSGAQARARTELLARRLKTISDPTRLAILDALRSGPRTVTEISEMFSLAQPTVSNHVKLLRDAGLVRNGDDGARRKLVVQPEVIADLLEHLEGILSVQSS